LKQSEFDALKTAINSLSIANRSLSDAANVLVSAVNNVDSANKNLVSYLNGVLVDATQVTPPVTVPPPTPTGNVALSVVGNKLLDASGAQFIPHGIEQMVGNATSTDITVIKSWLNTFHSLGANAVRLNKFGGLSDSVVLSLHQYAYDMGIVPYITYPESKGRTWFDTPSVKSSIQAMKNVVLDTVLEPQGDATAANIAAWVTDVKQFHKHLRDQGYKCALHFHSLQSGRNLQQTLAHAQEIIDADPLRNCFPGVQLYWPVGGWEWQADQGYGSGLDGIANAFKAMSNAKFPIQIGLALGDENKRPLQLADTTSPVKSGMLSLCKTYGIGYLHWDAWESNLQDALFNNSSMTNWSTKGSVYLDHPNGFSSSVLAKGF
jgi:hypothetical protein